MQAVVNNLLINYERAGSGKKLVLLHGWANSLNDMSGLYRDLCKHYDVINIDLPGFGKSQTPMEAWGLGDYAQFLAAFLKKVGAEDIYGLIGHSNGGAIAIKTTAENYLSPTKLVLLASSGIRANKQARAGLIKAATRTVKIASLPLPASTRKKLQRKLYSKLGSDLLIAENMSDSFKKVVAEDLSTDAKKLNLPTLLIYGEEDDQTPLIDGQIYHELIKDSTLEVITGAGHFIQKDNLSVIVKLIRDFL